MDLLKVTVKHRNGESKIQKVLSVLCACHNIMCVSRILRKWDKTGATDTN